MGFKCAPQVLGLVRGEPKPGQKRRANGLKISLEAGYERASTSKTLDRSRSKQNEYSGYKSGRQFWKAMVDEADCYRVKVQGKTKTGEPIVREKGLQHNSVIGWSVIYNPPSDVCTKWDRGTYERFFNDCRECMSIISSIFSKQNLRMSAIHWDEGIPPNDGGLPDGHLHDFGICKDGEGHYCGNLIDARLMCKINREFPQLMRDRGWDMDDLDTTDFELSKSDDSYRHDRDNKRKKFGLSVNRHIVRKSKQTAQEANRIIENVIQLQKELEEQKAMMAEEQYRLQSDAQRLKIAIDEFEKIRSEDSDLSRRKYMDHLRSKTGKTVEEMYQEYLKSLASERKNKLKYLESIANLYDQEHGLSDLSSLERNIGE